MVRAVLNLVKDHPQYKFPGHRNREQSENSGEEFRDTILIPFLKANREREIEIDLSGAVGYPPSFLDEAFAGCISKGVMNVIDAKITGIDEVEQNRIKRYLEKAVQEKEGKEKNVL
jgi:hypothetical protein